MPTSRDCHLKLLDAQSLTPAILAVVRCHLVVLAHVYAHVVEVVEAPLLRDPLRGLAVLCNQADRHRQRFCSNFIYAPSSQGKPVMIANLLPWIQTEILFLSDQAPSAALREGATCLHVSDSARDAWSDR